MIEWKEAQAGSGRWTADIGGETALFVWPFKGEYCFDFSLARGVDIIRDAGYPTLDAAKSAAETFAREWVAAQAAALGGGWISVEERLPEELTRAILCVVLLDLPSVQNLAIGTHSASRGWNLEGWGDGYPPSFTVTHWMELPPLPEVK